MSAGDPAVAPRLTISTTDWLLLVVLSILWGGTFFFAKIAVADIPPLTLALGRVGIGAVVLIAIARAIGEPLPRGKQVWNALLVMAFFNNVIPFGLIFYAQTSITAGLASILIATTPLFAVVAAHIATEDEKITPARVVGVLVGFSGVVAMIGPDLVTDLGAQVTAELCVLLAALFYALSGLYGRRFRAESPVPMAAGQMMAATVLLIPLSAVIERPWTIGMPSPTALAALIGLGALSTGLAYAIFFRVLASAGATNLMLVNFLNPVSAILLSAVFLGERLTSRQAAGMAAIAIGLAAIDGRPARSIARLFRRANSR
jgi:drug/metabolite transporter (DMT)-like permease